MLLFTLLLLSKMNGYSQQFSFSNEEGIIFKFNLKTSKDKILLSLVIENKSNNVCAFVDSSKDFSFNHFDDTTVFIGIGFDYKYYPYAPDIIKVDDNICSILFVSGKFQKTYTYQRKKDEKILAIMVGVDYLISKNYTIFNEKSRDEILNNHRSFNFTLPVVLIN